MKKVIFTLLASVAAVAMFSCKKEVRGSGPLITENRSVQAPFNEIALEAAATTYFTTAPEKSIKIVAQQNVLDALQTFVSGSKLVIKFKGDVDYRTSDDIKVYVTGPAVYNFVSSTAGVINVINAVENNTVYLRNDGAGSISITEVKTNALETYNNGSGYINIASGNASHGKARTIGSGSIDISGLSTANMEARTVGSGNIRTKVSNHLDARIEGTGSIYYKGTPSISSHVSGNGRLIKL